MAEYKIRWLDALGAHEQLVELEPVAASLYPAWRGHVGGQMPPAVRDINVVSVDIKLRSGTELLGFEERAVQELNPRWNWIPGSVARDADVLAYRLWYWKPAEKDPAWETHNGLGFPKHLLAGDYASSRIEMQLRDGQRVVNGEANPKPNWIWGYQTGAKSLPFQQHDVVAYRVQPKSWTYGKSVVEHYADSLRDVLVRSFPMTLAEKHFRHIPAKPLRPCSDWIKHDGVGLPRLARDWPMEIKRRGGVIHKVELPATLPARDWLWNCTEGDCWSVAESAGDIISYRLLKAVI